MFLGILIRVFVLFVFLGTETLFARVFRMNDETVATYFGGSYGPSLLKQTHFSGTSGVGSTVDKSVLINYGGEFGLLFRSSKLGLRLGVESIKPLTLAKAVGADSSGVKLYDFESNISALIPKVVLEFNLKSSDSWRTFLSIGTGTATASYKNSYTLTTDGQTAFPGVSDFSDEGTGTAILSEGAFCFETLMNDTTTVVFSLGYRKLEITGYKYKADVLNFSGNQLKGDSVLNNDGTAKTSLFNGSTVSILFRFYLGK